MGHVGFLQTRKILFPPSAKRLEVEEALGGGVEGESIRVRFGGFLEFCVKDYSLTSKSFACSLAVPWEMNTLHILQFLCCVMVIIVLLFCPLMPPRIQINKFKPVVHTHESTY